MRDKISRFMAGRYGSDQLSRAVSVLAIALIIVELFTRFTPISVVVLALLIWIYFRTLSRNIYKRSEENRKYLVFRNKITGFFRKWKNRAKQSGTYRFYHCPDCRQTVRVPKGRGKIEITCPKCHAKFIKKS